MCYHTRARVHLKEWAEKGHSAFPKSPALQELLHKVFQCHIRTLVGEWSYSSAEVLSVCLIVQSDWALKTCGDFLLHKFQLKTFI